MGNKFNLVVRDTDRHALRRLADADGMSQAALLRSLLRREARRRGLLADVADTQSQKMEEEHAT